MKKAIPSKLIFVLFASCFFISTLAQFDANCFGNRKTIVHLFEWQWADIADECERFLSIKGFCGVQISPPNEHRVIMNNAVKRPWWERYQPVSYKLYSRSGDEKAFINMVTRCNNVGVRVYVDAVLNHMAGDDAGSGTGIGGSSFNCKTQDFPDVPYKASDFHKKGSDCMTSTGWIENYQDPNQVRNCRLLGLVDLNHRNSRVRQKIVEFLNKLIGIGVAGFRFDAVKHIWPDDAKAIIEKLNDLNTKWFLDGSRPFIYQEVIDLGSEPIKSSEYYGFARVTEFNYGKYLSEAFSGKVQLKNLKTFGPGIGYLMPDKAALVFIDNHDNQRGHGAAGSILNFFKPRQYKMAVTFMLSWPYGQARVMSSYRWDRNFQKGEDVNDWIGPPHFDNWNIKPVTITDDDSCGNGWVCEHRWRPIANMARFRNIASNEKVENWWDDGDNQIAFSRGDRAFFAMNGGSRAMSVSLQTGMKPGRYCDVISGERSEDEARCTGIAIIVRSNGMAQIQISSSQDEPMIAIHLDSMFSGEGPEEPDTTIQNPSSSPALPSYRRTAIFVKYQTKVGEDLFLLGGISHNKRSTCGAAPSSCYIPINYNHVSYSTKHYDAYNAWSKGDNYLDWAGSEASQSSFNSKPADGSPMAWTTSFPSTDAGYNVLNTYGPHYWMLDVSMDCSSTEDGWFEVKAILNGHWEADISQSDSCAGTASLSTPFKSNNHIGKCGYKNVFIWGTNSCQIDNFVTNQASNDPFVISVSVLFCLHFFIILL